MDRRGVLVLGIVGILVATLAFVALGGLAFIVGDDYERTVVTVHDREGTDIATVEVRVADTFEKRYLGLSATETLEDGEGMLFVHRSSGPHAYVMRDMDFPLDIIFIDGTGRITSIHHATLPASGTDASSLQRYRGEGRYVLEVPYGYTNRTGIATGDCVSIEGEWGHGSCPVG